MRRLAITAVLLALATAGCGSTRTIVRTQPVAHPPNLGPPRGEALDKGGATGCGVERWAVKTGTDPGANQVGLAPQDTTIANLVAISPPSQPTDRVPPTETTTFRIQAPITFAKREADGDYHLGLGDSAGNTMIAESVDPSCATGSVVLPQIEQVRQALDRACPQIAQGQTVHTNVPAVLTGWGFFDRPHGQTDVASNAIELHPLTAVELQGGC